MTVYVGHLHLPFSKCFQFLFVNTLIYIVLAGAQQACVNVSPSIPLASWERALPVLTFINASLSNQTVEVCAPKPRLPCTACNHASVHSLHHCRKSMGSGASVLPA